MAYWRKREGLPLYTQSLDVILEIDAWVDVVTAREGDLCPTCGPLHEARGIEVSQVFSWNQIPEARCNVYR